MLKIYKDEIKENCDLLIGYKAKPFPKGVIPMAHRWYMDTIHFSSSFIRGRIVRPPGGTKNGSGTREG